MVIWVVKFLKEGEKFRKVFLLKINIQKGNYCILRTDVVTGSQKLQKSDFQNQFSMSKMMGLFPKKNFIKEYHFRSTFFCC